MPELPEVETTRRSLLDISVNKRITFCLVNNRNLRIPVPSKFSRTVCGQQILNWTRRGKYLIATLERGFILVHLGMSGRMTHTQNYQPVAHDHIVFTLDQATTLIYNDPRRFGCVLYSQENNFRSTEKLGVEPLSPDLNTNWLYLNLSRSKSIVKNFLMDQSKIAGLGNIYVSEALFTSGIHPRKPCHEIDRAQSKRLSLAIKSILKLAIKAGGTTLKDFSHGGNWKGYFSVKLKVYGRQAQPCVKCKEPIVLDMIAGRSTFLCPSCQFYG